MRQLRFTLGICVALALSASFAAAQERQGPYVTQASARLAKMIDAGNKAGFILSDNNFSIGGGWFKQSASVWVPLYSLTLDGGTTYRVIAAGDDDARDVDIEILDNNMKVVAKDTKADPTAVVEFTPQATGKYHVRIRLFDSRDNLPCVCIAIVLDKKK